MILTKQTREKGGKNARSKKEIRKQRLSTKKMIWLTLIIGMGNDKIMIVFDQNWYYKIKLELRCLWVEKKNFEHI